MTALTALPIVIICLFCYAQDANEVPKLNEAKPAGEATQGIFVPIQPNWLPGANGRYLEIGAGITAVNEHPPCTEARCRYINGINGTFFYGYRRAVDRGFCFRLGQSLLINATGIVPLFAGISVGYSFV